MRRASFAGCLAWGLLAVLAPQGAGADVRVDCGHPTRLAIHRAERVTGGTVTPADAWRVVGTGELVRIAPEPLIAGSQIATLALGPSRAARVELDGTPGIQWPFLPDRCQAPRCRVIEERDAVRLTVELTPEGLAALSAAVEGGSERVALVTGGAVIVAPRIAAPLASPLLQLGPLFPEGGVPGLERFLRERLGCDAPAAAPPSSPSGD